MVTFAFTLSLVRLSTTSLAGPSTHLINCFLVVDPREVGKIYLFRYNKNPN